MSGTTGRPPTGLPVSPQASPPAGLPVSPPVTPPTSPPAEDERRARLALTRLVEPGHRGVHHAVATLGAVETERALRAGRALPGISARLAASAAVRAVAADPAQDQARLEECGGRLVCPGDEEWPECLDWGSDLTAAGGRTLEAPPLALFVRGRPRLAELVERSVAVVGARAATRYGEAVAAELAAGLVQRGWSVISGGAYGIDAAAHRGALSVDAGVADGALRDQGGDRSEWAATTVAVLACGVDVAYPRGNERLLRQIAHEGLLVSELPPQARPTRIRFLVRNRLIAALGLGTVVVQAAPRSGSLSTLNRAGTLGRHRMVVPGPVNDVTSAGCHQALRDDPMGVVLVTRVGEVLECVGRLGEDTVEPLRGPTHPRDGLPLTVLRVLEAVPVRRGAGEAVIASAAGVSGLTVQQVLPALHLAGLVQRHPQGGWTLTTLGAGSPASSTN